MNDALGALLRLDTGLSRVVRELPVATATLPALGQVAPPEAAIVRHLDRFMNPTTMDQTVHRAMQPAIHSPDILRPDLFQAALDHASTVVEAVLVEAAPGRPRDDLQGLGNLLKERQQRTDALNYFRAMLIAG
jgi:Type III secretion system YscX (type_III_YscX)